MRLKLPWVDRVVFGLLGLMLIVDATLFLRLRMIDQGDNLEIFYRFPSHPVSVPPPDGYISSELASLTRVRSGAGWVVRYSGRYCPYCRKDEALWNPLQSKLKSSGYEIVIAVPNAKGEYAAGSEPVAGANPETFLNIGWIRQFRLTMTPTLLIFDSDGKLIWSRQGMLAPGDPASAMRAVKSATARAKIK